MTPSQFFEKIYYIPEKEYNVLYPFIKNLSFKEIAGYYAYNYPHEFYKYIFKNWIKEKKSNLYNPLTPDNFMFFNINCLVGDYSDEEKNEIIEFYYQLYDIYEKFHIDNEPIKSDKNYYIKEIMNNEPLFTLKNVTRLASEFSEDVLNCFKNEMYLCFNNMEGETYSKCISFIFKHWCTKEMNATFFETNVAKICLNRRKLPPTTESELRDFFNKYSALFYGFNVDYEKIFSESDIINNISIIYNKFIHWFEIDKFFTI